MTTTIADSNARVPTYIVRARVNAVRDSRANSLRLDVRRSAREV